MSAIGGLSVPNDEPPTLKGLKDFKGEKFHSALWRHDISLAGKRVGVIGNGCSAAQFVPEIAKDSTTQVLNFSRTPSWFFVRARSAHCSSRSRATISASTRPLRSAQGEAY